MEFYKLYTLVFDVLAFLLASAGNGPEVKVCWKWEAVEIECVLKGS